MGSSQTDARLCGRIAPMPKKRAQGERERVNTHSGFETKVLAAFIAAMLVVVGLVAATWKMAHDATDAARWISHTHQVIDNLTRIRGETLQIEFSTQGYRLTGSMERLIERDESIALREVLMERVRALLADNAVQMARLQKLRAVLDERLAISRRVVELIRTQGIQAATRYANNAPLQATRQQTYRLLREMEADELRLLDERNIAYDEAKQALVGSGLVLALLLSALLTGTYLLLRRQLRATEAGRQALIESEENLAITLHSIGDGVLVTDRAGRITRMNPVAEQLTGWTQAQALGHPIDEVFPIVHEETRAPAEIPVARVLATGEVQGLANHTTLIARDGRETPIADSAAPIHNARGEVVGVVLVFRDVSTERAAQRLVAQQNLLLEQNVIERSAQLRDSQEHLNSIINGAPALIAYLDTEQRFVYANTHYRRRFAPDGQEITGRTVREVAGEERYAMAGATLARALQGEPQSFDWQPFPDVWQVSNYVPRRDAQGQVIGCYVLGTDITERKRHESQIETLNAELGQRVRELEHVSRALRTLSAGNRTMLRAHDEQELLDSMCHTIVNAGGYSVAVVWFRSDDAGQSLWPAAEHGFPGGMAALRLLKTSWADNAHGRGAVGTAIRSGQATVVHDIASDPHYAPWRTLIDGQASGLACPLHVGNRVMGALAIYHPEPGAFDADEISLLSALADDLAFGITTLRERAEQQRTRQAMHHLTHHDALTGLANETQFNELLSAAVEQGLRGGAHFAMLQTNIERLGEINDALGFSHGDQLLRDFAQRLAQAAPSGTTVARLRGDEFALLLPGGDSAAAQRLAQRLHDVLSPPFAIADLALDITARIGIVAYPEHGLTPHDLFRHMDMAVRQAKKRGNGLALYDPRLNPAPAQRLTFAGELRRAIEGGQLALYLQPKVEMASGRVCGAEGLVRWLHPTRGMIPPGEFIELAEHTGLIRPLGAWVLETAFHLNQHWSGRSQALPIAINLSARNLRDESLLPLIRELQSTWRGGDGLLEIEITESTAMEDPEFALRVLHELRGLGVPLHIDDFGTGYSSLSYLQKLPVDCIKIDQSFVRNMVSSKESALIVRSTIDLAHDLGRKVVAEGVETRQHWEQLAALGCDMAQGYYIARPMPAEAFQAWLQDYRPPA
jgi:diguanylate cyclase (GGDEF)-like protein/PAS domain S-box-containing protein